VPIREGMIVGEADCPFVKIKEMYRLQPPLANLRSFFTTLDLLYPLRIAQWNGYALPLRYVSSLSRKPAISRIFVALAHAELITGAACSPMLRHQTAYSTVLLKRGMI
jgi:hypothetical protein